MVGRGWAADVDVAAVVSAVEEPRIPSKRDDRPGDAKEVGVDALATDIEGADVASVPPAPVAEENKLVRFAKGDFATALARSFASLFICETRFRSMVMGKTVVRALVGVLNKGSSSSSSCSSWCKRSL